MNRRLKNNGFSLTEVLLAAGILTIGFVLIAGVLPVGVKLTSMSTERTIAAVVADEAFAKIRLFGILDVDIWNNPVNDPVQPGLGVDPNTNCVEYGYVSATLNNPFGPAFAYPTTDIRPNDKKYFWTALCRYEMWDKGHDTFQVTVFVGRDIAAGAKYHYWDPTIAPPNRPENGVYPKPVPIPVKHFGSSLMDYIVIDQQHPHFHPKVLEFVTDDSILLDGRTGQIMKVRKGPTPSTPTQIFLEEKVFDVDAVPLISNTNFYKYPRYVWVVPPAVNSGRYPCVGVFQSTVKFNDFGVVP